MDLEIAAANFGRAIVHCDNLVTVHRRAGKGERGRRNEEVSINRAVVVIAVATWQAAIQDMTLACLDMSTPKAGTESYPAYRVIGGRVRKEIGDFATPNAEKTRRLLEGVGFDPRGSWTWKTYGGRGVGPVTVRPDEAETKLNEWLKVRHAIAHGHESLPRVKVLQAVRQAPNAANDPSLRLVDATQCLSLVRKLVEVTGGALAAHLSATAPRW